MFEPGGGQHLFHPLLLFAVEAAGVDVDRVAAAADFIGEIRPVPVVVEGHPVLAANPPGLAHAEQ